MRILEKLKAQNVNKYKIENIIYRRNGIENIFVGIFMANGIF